MNKEPKEESINIFKDIFIDFIVGYILINWILAFLLFCYEFIVGPMFNALSPGNNSVCLNLNLSKNSVNTLLNQLVPIPIDQFIESELILIVPSTIVFGILYYAAKKENHDE
jgi:hypothetical protein